jgi:hydroxymethylpyrimidine pyrophosphatase-like HAD family hydrolase
MIRFQDQGGFPGLLAADLDGTLASGGVLLLGAVSAAERLREAGIPVLVVTGRNPLSLGRVEGLWDVADEVIFSSGASILSAPDASPVELAGLEAGETARIIEILDRYGEDYCILDPIPGNHRFAWKRHRPPTENPDFDARIDLYRPWGREYDGRPSAACHVLVIRPAGAPANPEMEADLCRWSFFSSASPLDRASSWLEVFPAGTDKGSALAAWCRERGLPSSRVMALGNDFNDLPMLRWAGLPRVVPGSPEGLRNEFAVAGIDEAVEEALAAFGGSG